MKVNTIFLILIFCFINCRGKTGGEENMKKVYYEDFSEFNEDNWVAVTGPGYNNAGEFIQEKGFIQNFYPEDTDTSVMFHNETGYAMRVLKGVEARNGKAEAELMLMGFAAPSILIRSKIAENKNYESYYCVIFNQSTPQKRYEGINLWVYRGDWQLLKGFDIDIPRNKKIRFAVEFIDNQLTFYYNDTKVGSVNDTAQVYEESIGIVSMEGPNKFYSFSFTQYD